MQRNALLPSRFSNDLLVTTVAARKPPS